MNYAQHIVGIAVFEAYGITFFPKRWNKKGSNQARIRGDSLSNTRFILKIRDNVFIGIALLKVDIKTIAP